MIDIPLGKALVPVEIDIEKDEKPCKDCIMMKFFKNPWPICHFTACGKAERKDGKNVIIKLVDFPNKEAL